MVDGFPEWWTVSQNPSKRWKMSKTSVPATPGKSYLNAEHAMPCRELKESHKKTLETLGNEGYHIALAIPALAPNSAMDGVHKQLMVSRTPSKHW